MAAVEELAPPHPLEPTLGVAGEGGDGSVSVGAGAPELEGGGAAEGALGVRVTVSVPLTPEVVVPEVPPIGPRSDPTGARPEP
ncbi:unnamed protein product [Urochloa humidicola]